MTIITMITKKYAGLDHIEVWQHEGTNQNIMLTGDKSLHLTLIDTDTCQDINNNNEV